MDASQTASERQPIGRRREEEGGEAEEEGRARRCNAALVQQGSVLHRGKAVKKGGKEGRINGGKEGGEQQKITSASWCRR